MLVAGDPLFNVTATGIARAACRAGVPHCFMFALNLDLAWACLFALITRHLVLIWYAPVQGPSHSNPCCSLTIARTISGPTPWTPCQVRFLCLLCLLQ